ncbi:secretory phospholipase A2 receptor-like [Pectinophora gossypiella]|uniref:secretory phospholipase A2 receptor-like n=1 Tax=Pectinophora gossypiella TaxID=13191 RepID=UPI00214E1C6B|nr:secretory phospholipase A2 receptor-like [Pectinophora gossypiella]
MIGTKCVSILFLVLLTFLEANAQLSKRFFRKDYTYLITTEAFYKIHTVHRTWAEAKQRCEMEGASLFYAETDDEANDVISWWNQTQPFYWVYVGISDLLAQEVYETIDGRPVLDVYSNWGPGEPNNAGGVEDCVILRRDGTLNDDRCDKKYPFICKKSLNTLQWNNECDMPNQDYVYNDALGRCYKFHTDPKNWTEAITYCSAEQSYLAIINSQVEDDYLVKLTEDAKKDGVSGLSLIGAVYLGFHNVDGTGWKTIKGTPLEDTGYPKWGNQQPDGGTNETCGSMFYTGQLNDVSCHHKMFYICEHDIKNLSGAIDERFNQLIE